MDPALFLLLLNFALIGVLPKVFFRRDGSLNVRWWLTALPFGVCPVFIVLAVSVGWQSLAPEAWRGWLALAAVALDAASIALISSTLGTHRIPLALWHQDNDAPRHIVTYGAYGRIRHPFYAAFILAFLAALCSYPHWVTLAALGYGFAILNVTAGREERRLCASEFGAEYQEYTTRTGRFFPRLGRVRPAHTAQVAQR
jgi:protein-S-isoprenylcysteine O-methyltransferase Ste14